MTQTIVEAEQIPAIAHAEAMRLTAAENVLLLQQLRGLTAAQWTAALVAYKAGP